MQRLCDEPSLPAAGDVEILLPPSVRVWSRPLPAVGLSLVYFADESELRLVTLRLLGR